MQKRFFDNQSTQSLVPELPAGTFAFGEKYVKSKVITLPGHSTSCFISGRFDMVARFEDNTYGVLDFKTSEPRESNTEKYRRQLHAYTYALENPAPNSFSLSPVSLLGLLVLDPSKMVSGQSGKGYFIKCEPTWIPFTRNDDEFMSFIAEVLTVLEMPEPPRASPSCGFCNYREQARQSNY
ncbi:MAG TPA: PD-(D/E)XK nuclease family protein [candidate division Zixibacteria bacterium]|nr:PD-(D/E)XK nuclease family protein [candidate division Zixibacteria bacterium]